MHACMHACMYAMYVDAIYIYIYICHIYIYIVIYIYMVYGLGLYTRYTGPFIILGVLDFTFGFGDLRS